MFMPKIENWDNELANNIPPLMSQVIDTSKLKDNLGLSDSKYTHPIHQLEFWQICF